MDILFVKDSDGDPVAIIEPDKTNVNDCTCYAHIGQHSTCCLEWVDEEEYINPEECPELVDELKKIGYADAVLLDAETGKRVVQGLLGKVPTESETEVTIPHSLYMEAVDAARMARDMGISEEAIVEGIGDFLKKKVAPAAVGAALTLGAMHAGDIKDTISDTAKDYRQAVAEMGRDGYTLQEVSEWNFSGERLEDKMGWKYVDAKDKPGIYSDSFRSMSLDSIDGQPNIMDPNEKLKVGWYVSPDGKKVFSTVTGKVFFTDKPFTDPSFTKADLGEHDGVGLMYIPGAKEFAYPWDDRAMYGRS